MSSENKSLLTKGIGGIGAALLVLNGLIGAGIFALPAKMAAELGAFSPYIFLIFGALMLAIVWCFGQLLHWRCRALLHCGACLESAQGQSLYYPY